MADDAPKLAAAEIPSDIDLNVLPIVEPEDGVFEAYANMANLTWTLDDISIRFSVLTREPDDEDPTWKAQRNIILEKAAITLPWRQAKLLALLLAGVIQNYETINGSLTAPKLPAAPKQLLPEG
jgi:hypothetical protein